MKELLILTLLALPLPAAAEACKEPAPGAPMQEIITWLNCVELPAPPAAGTPAPAALEKRTLVHPKVAVSPVTEHWKDTVLVKFRKVSFDTVKETMRAAGARQWAFAESDGLYIVRVDIKDAEAPRLARALAMQPGVDSVEVNRAVYAALQAGSKAAAKQVSYSYFDEINLEACPGARELGPSAMLCRVPGALDIHRLPARREHQVKELPFNGWDAVSLNVLPDDSTNRIYEYSYELRAKDGRLAGYAQRQGYENSEAEIRLDLMLKYNTDGELASVTVI